MTTPHQQHPLYGLFEPQAVAILGASSDPNKLGGRPIRFLRDGGFQGKVFPVNSRNTEIQGYPAFSSIKDIPGPVDQAIIILPATACQAALAVKKVSKLYKYLVQALQRSGLKASSHNNSWSLPQSATG